MKAPAAVLAVLLTVIACCTYLLFGEDDTTLSSLPSAPTHDIYVADFAGMVGAEERQKMLSIGQDLDKRFEAQLVVATVNSLEGESIESYANQLFRSWGIGNAEKNNGVLLLIAKDDRKFRVEVGYGLEGAITDGYAGEVLDGMKGKFREDKYSVGTLEAYQKLAQQWLDGNYPIGGIPDIDENGLCDLKYMFDNGWVVQATTRQFDKNRDYLWPVPAADILVNPALTQNPGY